MLVFGQKNKLEITSIIKDWWWVILCVLMSYGLHLHANQQKHQKMTILKASLSSLSFEKMRSLEYQNELKDRLDCQGDPEWIAMILMKGLGVVPEGQTKVHFQEINDNESL
ncbi:MAG: hypothetical protein K9M07_06520 [Simkaniaceae bacterium]|nr:hypothetical protein [Simkaniaceae bacterium]